MALKRRTKINENYSMASMTDVIFLLLIFFMISSTVVIPNAIKVTLPQSQKQTAAKPLTRLTIDAGLNYYLAFECQEDVVALIGEVFAGRICGQADVAKRVQESPIELAYTLALVEANQRYSVLLRWLLHHYPAVEEVLFGLRNHFCGECVYCGQALDARAGLKRFFGYEAFRLYDGQPLQEQAVQAAIRHESLLAIFPTGGGKSLTFQIPALISGEANKGLTVVISPLQSLMKDQVDNLERQGVTAAVTINGLLDVIERQQALERVVNGTAAFARIAAFTHD